MLEAPSLLEDRRFMEETAIKLRFSGIIKKRELDIALTFDKSARRTLRKWWERYGILDAAEGMLVSLYEETLEKLRDNNGDLTLVSAEMYEAFAYAIAFYKTRSEMAKLVGVRVKEVDGGANRLRELEEDFDRAVTRAVKNESRKVTKLESANKVLSAELRKVRSELSKADKIKNDLAIRYEKDQERFDQVVGELNEELARLTSLNNELEERNKELADRINGLECENDGLRDDIDNLSKKLEDASALSGVSSLKTEMYDDLPLPIAFALAHLHKVPDPDDPSTWTINADDAPDATCWNMLMLAAKNRQKFGQEVWTEMVRLQRSREEFNREKERKELESRLKTEAQVAILKAKQKIDKQDDEDDIGISELDDIIIEDQLNESGAGEQEEPIGL